MRGHVEQRLVLRPCFEVLPALLLCLAYGCEAWFGQLAPHLFPALRSVGIVDGAVSREVTCPEIHDLGAAASGKQAREDNGLVTSSGEGIWDRSQQLANLLI